MQRAKELKEAMREVGERAGDRVGRPRRRPRGGLSAPPRDVGTVCPGSADRVAVRVGAKTQPRPVHAADVGAHDGAHSSPDVRAHDARAHDFAHSYPHSGAIGSTVVIAGTDSDIRADGVGATDDDPVGRAHANARPSNNCRRGAARRPGVGAWRLPGRLPDEYVAARSARRRRAPSLPSITLPPPRPRVRADFGQDVFSALVLVLCAGISSHLCFGFSTRQSRETFIGLIFLIMLGYQFFHLIRAALYVPATPFTVYNQRFHRTDCLNSGKGGKRPFKSNNPIYKNPCFCVGPGAVCTNRQSGQPMPAVTCPVDGTATCMVPDSSGRQVFVKPYISHFRNCVGGQGSSCTLDQPCYPCSRATLPDWGPKSRCRACTSGEGNTADCTFIPGKGPYCYDHVGSRKVVPCTTCCTEPAPLFRNGTCY